MKKRTRRGGRPPTPSKGHRSSRHNVSAPPGAYTLRVSKALSARVPADEIDACFTRALRNIEYHFTRVNDGNAVVTPCQSKKGIKYWIAIDLTQKERPRGGLVAYAQLPYEFGQDH